MLSSFWSDVFDPFREFDRLQEELDRLFDLTRAISPIRGVVRGTFPAINVGETTDEVKVYVFAPGVDPNKVELTIEGNLLSISGERDASEGLKVREVKPERFYRRERFSGRFQRIISLPESIDPNKVEARYSDGIIIITVGKKEEVKPRQIPVEIK
ncbi:Hsp20/alpha crystallin family protein [Thermosulfuriphilus sp.]